MSTLAQQDEAEPRIRADGVSRTFSGRLGATLALDDVSLEVGDGEFLCIVGPSGCGKSTFLRILAGLLRPSSGSVDIVSTSVDKPLCATVFQEYSVFPWMTVEQNVAFGLQVARVAKAEARARTERWLEIIGLTGFRNAYPNTLSGGMKQRVALARALVMEPQVLLMDEPFGALDAQLRMIMQEELLRIWQAHQHTVVLITHSLDEAILLGDRVALMSARPGRLTATIDVPFERPRSSDVRSDPAFGELEQEIWRTLRSEVEPA